MVCAGTTDRITPLLHQYYISRLRDDLPRWIERGWIRREDMDAILADAASSDRASGSLPNILALLGAVLVAAGALLFLAANWEGMGGLPSWRSCSPPSGAPMAQLTPPCASRRTRSPRLCCCSA
jgi:hypothetical protein